jgi:hypothetical protein
MGTVWYLEYGSNMQTATFHRRTGTPAESIDFRAPLDEIFGLLRTDPHVNGKSR